jgi:hypothetical protein
MKQKFFSQISDHQQSVAPAPSRGLPHTPSSAGVVFKFYRNPFDS